MSTASRRPRRWWLGLRPRNSGELLWSCFNRLRSGQVRVGTLVLAYQAVGPFVATSEARSPSESNRQACSSRSIGQVISSPPSDRLLTSRKQSTAFWTIHRQGSDVDEDPVGSATSRGFGRVMDRIVDRTFDGFLCFRDALQCPRSPRAQAVVSTQRKKSC